MFQFTNGRTAVSSLVVPTGLLIAGLTLAAGTSIVAVNAALSTPPDRATDPAATQPPVAASDPDTDPQDATSPMAPAHVDATLDTSAPPVEDAEPAAPSSTIPPPAEEAEPAAPSSTNPPPVEETEPDAPLPADADGAEAADEPADVPTTTATGASSTGDIQLARVEAIADGLPFDWRAAGATFRIGCAPQRPTCHWGLYTSQQRVIWIGPGAFASEARLFYVVAHETAHAWQYANDPHSRLDDMKDWRRTGADGLEAAADCLAQVWGAATTYYWNCPSEARQHMQRVFASTQ